MRTFTADELQEIKEKHVRWIRSEDGGARANLAGANLAGANLAGANLAGANLARADLTRADLTGADLTGAYLTGAYLTGADLAGANLTGADLTGADLTGADLTGATGIAAPVITNIDAAILTAITEGVGTLDMSAWHTCNTTHCRAGWAIRLAGHSGLMLEDRIGPSAAGALIYAASRPGRPVPDFMASDEDAMADIKTCAAEQLAAQ